MILRLLRFLAVALLWALPAVAQEAEAPDYKQWEALSSQVEEIIAEGAAPDAQLSELRSDIVDWRADFTAAQSVNKSRIDTVRGQIEALGPAPAEGEAEDPTIAKRRAELGETLARLQAPGLAAVEAASRADGIIRAIDKIIRERQTDRLLRVAPLPINPINWPAALLLGTGLTEAIIAETRAELSDKNALVELREKAPAIGLFSLIALLLLIRGRHWMGSLSNWALRKSVTRARQVVILLASVLQIVLPFIGVTTLAVALRNTGLFGPIAQAALEIMPRLALIVLVAWWLAQQLFPLRDTEEAPFNLLAVRRKEARAITVTLGLSLAVLRVLNDLLTPSAETLLRPLVDVEHLSARIDAALSVIEYPLIVVAALFLFRLGQLLRRHYRNQSVGGRIPGFGDRVAGWTGTAVLAVALISPLLGAVGYMNAAHALIWPTVQSLGLFGLVLVLQRFIGEAYVFVTGNDESARDALLPVLVGFLLVLIAVPVFALIWGARVEDLMELWTAFRNGMSVGGVRISPGVFLTFAMVFVIGYMATRLIQGALKSSILPKTQIDKGGQNAIVSGTGYVGIFAAALVAISAAGIDLSSLAIVAGALSVGIGFGLQNIVSNFVSGIILLIERPISEGDWIQVGDQQGIVRAISVRSTIIETFDRTDVIVPNADLVSGQVTNWTRGNKTGRLIVPVGVAYGSDTRKIAKMLLEIAEAHPLVMMQPEPQVLFIGFGADSLNFEIRAMLSDVNFKLRVQSEMNHQIAEKFTAEGVEIPFAQRDIWLRNPEALGQPAPRSFGTAPSGASAPPGPGTPEPGEGMADTSRLSDNDGAEEGDER